MMLAIKTTIAVVLAAIRIAGHKSPAFQAVAHLFVGGLVSASFIQFDFVETEGRADRFYRPARDNFVLAAGLTVVEVVCFLFQGVH